MVGVQVRHLMVGEVGSIHDTEKQLSTHLKVSPQQLELDFLVFHPSQDQCLMESLPLVDLLHPPLQIVLERILQRDSEEWALQVKQLVRLALNTHCKAHYTEVVDLHAAFLPEGVDHEAGDHKGWALEGDHTDCMEALGQGVLPKVEWPCCCPSCH